MPCYSEDPNHVKKAKLLLNPAEKRLAQAIKVENELTEMLCSLCKEFEFYNLNEIIEIALNGKLKTWWDKHKKKDLERFVEEE